MDREAWTLRQFNRQRARFGEDVCDILSGTETTDDYGASSPASSPSVTSSGLRCFLEPVTQAESVLGGAEIGKYTHRVTIETTSGSLAINRSNKIRVAARGSLPVRTLDNPTSQTGSYAPLAVYIASLRSV